MLTPTTRKRLAIGGSALLVAMVVACGWGLHWFLQLKIAGTHIDVPFQAARSMAIERLGPGGIRYSVNAGEAVFRLESLAGDDASRKVFPNYADAMRYAREHQLASIPSVPLVLTTCRSGDARMQAALEKLLDDDAQAGRRVLIHRWLGSILSRRELALPEARGAYDSAAAYLATALVVAGETPELPPDIQGKVTAAAVNDPPLGPWATEPELSRIWHRDRSLAKGIVVTDDASAAVVAVLARTMMGDDAPATGWKKQLAVSNALVGPSSGVTFESLAEVLPAVPDGPPAGPADCAMIRKVVAGQSGSARSDTVAPGFAAWVSSPEEEVLAPLGLAAWGDPVGCLIEAIRSGRIALESGPDAGFYRRRWFALETLAAPNKAPEALKLQLAADYVRRWQRAFAAGFTEGRSGFVKRLPMVTLGSVYSEDDWPVVEVAPRFSAEPAPVVYLRLARAYRLLGRDLESVLGREAWRRLRDGQGNLVAEDLGRRATVLLGLALTVYRELGFPPPLVPEEIAIDAHAAESAAVRWCGELEQNPDARQDARLLVTLCDNGVGELRCPAVLGVRLEPVKYDWVETPAVQGGVKPRFVAARYWLASPCPATLTVREIPTVDEFRKRCDGHAGVDDLYAAFGQRAPRLHTPVHGWWHPAFAGAAVLTAVGLAAWWWRRRLRRHRRIIMAGTALATAAAITWAVVAPPVWLLKFVLVRVMASHENIALAGERIFAKWAGGRSSLVAIELMKDPDPQLRYFGAFVSFNCGLRMQLDEEKPPVLTPDEVEFFRQKVSDEVPEVATVAWMVLAESVDEIPFLIDQLDHSATPAELWSRLASLARFQPGDRRVIDAVARLAADPRAGFRTAVFRSLRGWRLAVSEFAAVKHTGCRDADAEVRENAVRSLENHGSRADVPVVLEMWSDPEEHVRIAAFATLDKLAATPAYRKIPTGDLPEWTDSVVQSALVSYAANPAVTLGERLSAGRWIADPVNLRDSCRRLLPEVEKLPPFTGRRTWHSGGDEKGWTREIARARLVTRWISAGRHAGAVASKADENAVVLEEMPELCEVLAGSIVADADPAHVMEILRGRLAKPRNRGPIQELIRRLGAQ